MQHHLKKTLMIFCALTVICSCQPALVNFPKLPDCTKPIKKQNLEMPPPIPDTMKLEIEGGNVVDYDKNGVIFLKMYHELRKAIKAQ